jgi:23S rRNA (cytidine1920-2'-O)/16S rRNA (cytidine1409-2'-O)-methyltransferase
MRLDLELVGRGLVATRSRARDMVVRGLVTVNGQVVSRPALEVGTDDIVDLTEAAAASAIRVSRGGEKLAAALDAFAFDAAARIALDVGASTGGFTEELLTRGAARVYAVDVGRAQLHPRLAGDPRVRVMEGQDARQLSAAMVTEPVGAITVDVSFISLAKVLPAALTLSTPGAWLVALVKPQFEVGPGNVGKGGIVRDQSARQRACDDVAAWLSRQSGWTMVGVIASPIAGGSGNQEFLLGAVRHE